MSSRYDVDLLAGIPLLALAAALVKPLRRWVVFAGSAALFILSAVSVFAIPGMGLAVAVFHLLSLAVAATVVWAAGRSQRDAATGPLDESSSLGETAAAQAIRGR